MDDISTYESKEFKEPSFSDNEIHSSFTYGNMFMQNKKPFWMENKDEDEFKKKQNSSRKALKQYLMRNYKSHIHYNSSEPEKFGAKAFTKKGEIYLAPGSEDSLDHELAHVYQQQTTNIPTTTEIGKEKVNLDPKLEQEADQIANNIEDYIPEILSEDSNNMGKTNITQFKMPNDKEFYKIIKKEAKQLKIAPHPRIEILNKAKEYYRSNFTYSMSFLYTKWSESYPNICARWALEEIKNKNPVENELYLELENSKKSSKLGTESERKQTCAENSRIGDIISMLSTEKIFEHATGNNDELHTLHEVILKLDNDQQQKLKECILSLKNYCDSKGIKSVLQSANKNGTSVLIDFNEDSKETLLKYTNYFIERLSLITKYIRTVANEKYSDKEKFGDKYWIRSTGSDLHNNGEHALFLVNKQNQGGHKCDDTKKEGKIAKVYKPHDLRVDNAVVGNDGMFKQINEMFNDSQALKGTIIEDEDAFATMEIDTQNHTEEFIIKKSTMTQEEAKKYFFRAGMLKVITDAMAVIDLHYENIMPTGKNSMFAPLIIDAETNFFQYIPSNLEEALRKDDEAGEDVNSSFNVKGEKEKSGKLFKDDKSQYYQTYKEGYDFMLNHMYENMTTFADIYEEQLQKVDKTRIIPISTADLITGLHNHIELGNEETLVGLSDLIAKELCVNTRNNDSEGFIFKERNNLRVNLSKSELNEAIKATLENGTIIALYVDMEGKIYLGNSEIGKIVTFQGNFDVNKEDIINVMKQSFLNQLEERVNFPVLSLIASDLFS